MVATAVAVTWRRRAPTGSTRVAAGGPSRPDEPACALYGARAERTGVAAALAYRLFDRIGVGTGVTSVLDYSDPCMSAAADLPIELLDGATFKAVRVDASYDINDNGNVTCGEIVVAAEALFGAYWHK